MALFQSPLCSSLGATEADGIGQTNWLQDIAAQHRHPDLVQPIGRHSSTCTQVVWISFWLVVLILIAYPVALMAAFLYAILNPLTLVDCCKPVMQLLLEALNLPLTCVRNMAEAKQLIVM